MITELDPTISLEQEPTLSGTRERLGLPAGFTTEKGSTYTYDEEGKTTRFKTVEGKQYPRQGITVFADLDDPKVHLKFLEAYHKMGDPDLKVHVLERLPDDTPQILYDVNDVQDPSRLYLGLAKDGKLKGAVPASLNPIVGRHPVDTRKFREDGKVKAERHIGHKVTSIQE